MAFKMELVIVILALVGCFAQDISFPEGENPGEEGSDNRAGGGPFFGRPRPGGNNFRPNSGFQPGRFPQNSNQGFNSNGQRPQNFNQGFNSNGQRPQNSNQGFDSNGQRPQNFNQGFNSNDQFSQNQGFNPDGQFPQNSNQGFNSNGQRPQNFNSDAGFGSQTPSPPAQTSQGSGLRPPPKSSQKIVSLVPCSCPFTPEYSPVCGTDSQTYLNPAVLNCFRTCGFDVSVARTSACAQTAGRTRISK